MKKVLMILLLFSFIALILSLAIVKGKARLPVSIEGPPPSVPTINFPTVEPTQAALIKELSEIESDLKLIEDDLGKMDNDIRLAPPAFKFNLGI